MRKMKRVVMGLLLVSTLMMYNAVAFAADNGCVHDWAIYMKKPMYHSQPTLCKYHYNCTYFMQYYDCIDFCKKCDKRHYYQTAEEIHTY